MRTSILTEEGPWSSSAELLSCCACCGHDHQHAPRLSAPTRLLQLNQKTLERLSQLFITIAAVSFLAAWVLAPSSMEEMPARGGELNQPLIAERPRIDLGMRNQHERLPVKFCLRNSSISPLQIMNVDAECSCTAIDFEKSEVPPRGVYTLKVEWQTGIATGITARRVMVNYCNPNSEEMHQAILTITANIIPDIEFSPPAVVFNLRGPNTQVVSAGRSVQSFESLQGVYAQHRAFRTSLYPKENAFKLSFDRDRSDDAQLKSFLKIVYRSKEEPFERSVLFPVSIVSANSTRQQIVKENSSEK